MERVKEHIQMYLESPNIELEESKYAGEDALKVRGIAITEGTWNGVEFSKEELKKGVESLCPGNVCKTLQLRANHSRDVWDIVGKVNNFTYSDTILVGENAGPVKSGIIFEAEVRLEKAVERVKKDLWGPVSVGVWADLHRIDVPKENSEDGEMETKILAKNLEFEHLAWVTSPACKDANSTNVLNNLECDECWEDAKIIDGEQKAIKVEDPLDNTTFTIPFVRIDNGKGQFDIYTSTNTDGNIVLTKVEIPDISDNMPSVKFGDDEMKENKTEVPKEPTEMEKTEGEDNKEVISMAEDQPKDENKVEAADTSEPEVIETEDNKENEVVETSEEIVNEDVKNTNDGEIEKLKSMISEQKEMIDKLIEMRAEKPEPKPEPEPAKVEEAARDEPENTIDNSDIIKKILDIDPSADKDNLVSVDRHGLDVLLNFLIRNRENTSVEGQGVVQESDSNKTINQMSDKDLIKAATKMKGADFALGEIIRTLWSRPTRAESYIEF